MYLYICLHMSVYVRTYVYSHCWEHMTSVCVDTVYVAAYLRDVRTAYRLMAFIKMLLLVHSGPLKQNSKLKLIIVEHNTLCVMLYLLRKIKRCEFWDKYCFKQACFHGSHILPCWSLLIMAHTWFLEIVFVHYVGMCVCVCASAPKAINNYSCEIKL